MLWNGGAEVNIYEIADSKSKSPRQKKRIEKSSRKKTSDTGAEDSKRSKGPLAKRNYPRRKPTHSEFAATRSNDEL